MDGPVSVDDLIGLIRKFLAQPSTDPVGRFRQDRVRAILSALESGGYPTDEQDRIALSVIPYVFQEANYDNIDWWSRDASGNFQLKDILEIDFLAQMAGKRRETASDAEMEAYRQRSLRAIKLRKTAGSPD